MLLAVRDVEAETVVSAQSVALGQAIKDALNQCLDSGGKPRPQRWLATQVRGKDGGKGVDPAVITRFVLGQQTPTLEQLSDMARALGVSTRSLLTKAGYIDDNGLVDPDHLPDGARNAIRAILRDVEERISGNRPNGVNGVD
jgi:hypothetical protein